MRKIRLKLDALSVESFQTAEAPTGTGTVRARQEGDELQAATDFLECPRTGGTCPRRLSEYASCVVYCECTDARVRCHDTVAA